MFEDNEAFDEIMEEYNKIPVEDRAHQAKHLAETLYKIGMSDDEVYALVSNWKRNKKVESLAEEEWDPQAEMMKMYGASNERELDDWIESNNPFSD